MILNKTRRAIATLTFVLAVGVGTTALPTPLTNTASAASSVCNLNTQFYSLYTSRSANYNYGPGQFCLINQNAYTIFQTDGNFVTYVNGRATWSSHTPLMGATRLSLQGDGNVVIYRGNTALWNTHTAGKYGDNNQIKQFNTGALNIYVTDYSGRTTQVW